ncbi:MAG TPA: alanine--tRNA ligase [Phycisphaerales bacterium]|nr:alanine--tRNA ligase [Phycisphaerales bacterium]
MHRLTADQVRSTFVEFFRERGHTLVPSSPVVPHDDPTLLFANAGMNQFKPLFLGTAAPGSPLHGLKRAANTQKCIRAGGKHNDLEDVGKDTYHHTFFEMLGNWSFGDYFKAEAIGWAWELLTKVYGVPGDRLYATYFGGDPATGLPADEEARELWLRHLPAGRVLPGSFKDNFWEMGETGPCGPCSEIHFDRIGGRDAARLVNTGDPDVIEVWNLVFIQFDRQADGSLRPLPARHVDTGMGLERLTSILQGARSNYDTDLFSPLFEDIMRKTAAPHEYRGRLGERDEGRVDTAYRVIADHVRTLTFAIADGATPSNEGRGYVLRRVLRRAVRFGHQFLGARTGFLSEVVPAVVRTMGTAFPELRAAEARVVEIIHEEEVSFGKTLDRGMKLFEEAATAAGNLALATRSTGGERAMDYAIRYATTHGLLDPAKSPQQFSAAGVNWNGFTGRPRPVISGEDVFTLYDTYGFPLDLTVLMAEERGIGVDTEGFERLMAEQRERSRAGAKEGGGGLTLSAEAIDRLGKLRVKPTNDSDKHHGRDLRATVRAVWNGANFDEHTTASDGHARVGVILDRTNFYAESGGQVADHGRMLVTREASGGLPHGGEFRVEDVRSFGGYVVHIGRVVRGEIRVGDDVQLHVDHSRRGPTAANHTATHLLNLALRRTVGAHVDQKGSLVAPDRLRFDFANNGPVSPEHLGESERIVRELIGRDLPVYADLAPQFVARGITGLRAVFGEAYPDPVRVVSIGVPVSDLLEKPDDPRWAEYSVEFCGGTHLASTGEAMEFALVSETGIAKGVRRIEAVTGAAALAAHAAADAMAARIEAASSLAASRLRAEVAEIGAEIDELTMPVARKAELRAALLGLQERLKSAAKEESKAKSAEAAHLAKQIAESAGVSPDPIIVATLDAGGDRQALQAALQTIRDRCPRKAVMLLSVDDGEKPAVSIIAGVPEELVKLGIRAGDWVREAAQAVGGKGGGRPDQAQGGGPEVGKVKQAVAAARTWAMRQVTSNA